MLHEKNIAALKHQLHTLGFGDGKERDLRSNICFQPLSFDVPFLLHKDGDVINFRIRLELADDGQYACNYYDAVLRKAIEIPVAGEALELKMQLIDWTHIAEHAEKIEEVVIALQALADDADGKKMAHLLKFKYWSDTPAENLVPNMLAFRNQYEISQRFYISNGQGINAEEAYRFLCNRWVEKKLLAKKRAQESTGKNDGSFTPNGGAKINKRKR